MRCAWQAYLNILPHWMRSEVDRQGRDTLQELRMRIARTPELIMQNTTGYISRKITSEDIAFVINAASEYSPWSAKTVAQGFLTASGGHRIGICGIAVVGDKKMLGISQPTSLCLRVARDFENIAAKVSQIRNSILIIGPPGSGKTTLLRDLIRCKSNMDGECVSVVDERQELFPMHKAECCFSIGPRTDVLSGCPKSVGIESVLRSMNPRWIAVDEITAQSDCEALLHAGWCGVHLLATAHADSIQDLKSRPVYQPLIHSSLFETVLVLRRDKSWTMERMHV